MRFVMLLCALGIAGCAPTVDTRGNLPTPERLAQVVRGESREDVSTILGTPSSVSPFDEEIWYYISARTESVAFFKPEVIERKVVAVRFDKGGRVSEVKTFGMEDGKPVEMIDRETPTAGKDLNVIQQLLGNVGKFNADKKTGRAKTPGGL